MSPRPFRKLLIANRGEIACRVIKTARALGYATVAVASDADADARHTRLADETVRIGPAPVGQSYLDGDRIIEAARVSGADAIHPGYGFLSENAAFAECCVEAGLVFVGPSADAIRAMGDKAAAKRRMIAAGVPCVPGYEGADQDDARLAAEAERIGFPVMIKAVAGGGGRGMRLVSGPADFAEALASARSESRTAFGDATVLLERAIVEPRHVEIQVFGDHHGAVIHLGERDCSVQRRHQKVIEEAPSPAVDPALREAMGKAATDAARAIGYVGAGTVEFLLDASGRFYFLEMNTRLQVEHPVTELVTGLDLVKLQLEVAAGAPLPLTQADVAVAGHAIEVRLYAEDPYAGFLPQSGQVAVWRPPEDEGVRVDHGVVAGVPVPANYDAMVAKLVAWGEDRPAALRRLTHAVRGTVLLGPQTNKSFLLSMLGEPEFRDGRATTGFIGRVYPDGPVRPEPSSSLQALAAVLAVGDGEGWRSNRWLADRVALAVDEPVTAWSVRREGQAFVVASEAHTIRIDALARDGDRVRWTEDGLTRTAVWAVVEGAIQIDDGEAVFSFVDQASVRRGAREAGGDGIVRAPMTGGVVAVAVAVGDAVVRGQLLMSLEAMKMEHRIVAAVDGVVQTLAVTAGAQVASRDILAVIAPHEAPT